MEGQFNYGSLTLYYIVPEYAEIVCYFHGSKEMLKRLACEPEATQVGFLAVEGEDWNRDLSPWAAPAVFRNGGDFAGEAAKHLSFLAKEVIPQTEERLRLNVARRGLLGYSLAGLFALYAMYETDIFTEFASVSGSLWYDGFVEYVRGREPKRKPDKVYLSLGMKEKHTKNPRLARIEECTEAVQEYFWSMGIHCILERNSGNHFYQEEKRMQKAVRWLYDSLIQ